MRLQFLVQCGTVRAGFLYVNLSKREEKMNKKDSVTHDASSPKHSWRARKEAKETQAEGKHPPATPAPVRQIGLSDVRETFDVPHTQYY